MHINLGISRLSRKGTDATTEHTKKGEIGTTASAQLKCGGGAITMRKTVGDENKMA